MKPADPDAEPGDEASGPPVGRRGDHRRGDRRAPPPLDIEGLERLAIAYVGRYATTRAKLRTYLARKLRERGGVEDAPDPIDAIVERCATLGYIDDRQFAVTRAASLGRRGYGARRVADALRAAGIEPADAEEARTAARDDGWASAVAFARRRRFGPFAPEVADADRKAKAMAAMMRAGHAPGVARRMIDMPPGAEVDPDLPPD